MRFSIRPRFDAAAVWTSAVCPSRRIVSVMPSAVSGLTKDDAPSAALAPGGSGRQSSTLTVRQLRVHRAAENGDRLAEQRLRSAAAAGADDGAGALVADRHRLAQPPGHRLHRRIGNARGRDRALAAAAHGERRQVGGAEQEADVGRIDRRRLDANDDLVRRRCRRRHAHERELELAARLDDRAELEPVCGNALVHGCSSAAEDRSVARIAPVPLPWRPMPTAARRAGDPTIGRCPSVRRRRPCRSPRSRRCC